MIASALEYKQWERWHTYNNVSVLCDEQALQKYNSNQIPKLSNTARKLFIVVENR